MPEVQYGKQTIAYRIVERKGLTSHYISVARGEGAILKGEPLSPAQADALILKKARWILDKLELVKAIGEDEIVTGSRMPYLGRRYYVELYLRKDLSRITLDFTASKFKVYVPERLHQQEALHAAFAAFYRQKAIERITPRVHKWSAATGLAFDELKFRKLEKRWAPAPPPTTSSSIPKPSSCPSA